MHVTKYNTSTLLESKIQNYFSEAYIVLFTTSKNEILHVCNICYMYSNNASVYVIQNNFAADTFVTLSKITNAGLFFSVLFYLNKWSQYSHRCFLVCVGSVYLKFSILFQPQLCVYCVSICCKSGLLNTAEPVYMKQVCHNQIKASITMIPYL